MMDRKLAPKAQEIKEISIVQPAVFQLDNGIRVYELNAGSQDILKIDFFFEAGGWFQSKRLITALTSSFLKLGTKKFNAQQIAETFDVYGAHFQLSADQHNGVITVLCLSKHLENIIEVVEDVVKFPTFPENEIRAIIGKNKQSFIVENEKVKVKAQKLFTQTLFGTKFPYANNNKLTDFDQLERNDFVKFHANFYTADRCKIILAGRVSEKHKQLMNTYFGGDDWFSKNQVAKIPTYKIESSTEKKAFVSKENALQSAIRIGKLLPNIGHEDYMGVSILLTILGGYFGSRLMSNIREDKGYTYGIQASYATLPKAAYLNISTEVGVDVVQLAIAEIYREIELLQKKPVGEEELLMVKNFLLGEQLRNFDGIFSLTKALKTVLDFNIDYQHYQKYIYTLKTITAEQLQALANKYLQVDSLYEVVAGKN